MTMSVQTDPCDELLVGLRIALSEQGSSTTIRFDGEWDLAAQEAARRAVRHALSRQPARVVLDLSGLTFIDSSGIHVVIELVKRSARLKIELAIIPGPAAVQRIFDVCALTARLPFTSYG
jgi:anti-anti-sigma factor